MSITFCYTNGDFIFETKWNEDKNSNFDSVLREKWINIHENGNLFKYKLKIEHSRVLLGKYKLLAQVYLVQSFILLNYGIRFKFKLKINSLTYTYFKIVYIVSQYIEMN